MLNITRLNGWAIALAMLVGMTGLSRSAAAQEAPADFPPGAFTDGGRYSLKDFEGKAVVLFFYESDCPRCRGSIPARNEVIEKFKDKPVKFIAIAPLDSLNDARAYVQATKLAMPVFADTLGVMQHQYGISISLQNIWQVRVIGPEGSIIANDMSAEALDAALASVKWKFKDAGYDPKLNGVIELLEWNQYAAALKMLRPMTKRKGEVGESAKKLYEAVMAEGKQWAQDAAAAADAEPVKAFDLYMRVAECFPDQDFGKEAKDAATKLKANETVKSELAARRMYDALNQAFTSPAATARGQIAAYCEQIAKKYPNTPTADKAKALGEEVLAAAPKPG